MEETKFLTKTKLIILGALILLVVLTVVVIFVRRNKLKNEYIAYEKQLEYAASNYLLKEKITLKTNEWREIDVKDILKQKLVTNKRSNDCSGYVIAQNNKGTNDYKAYITCKNIYKTDGYGTKPTDGSQNKNKTQTQKDTEKPVITLFGDEEITIIVGEEYEELNATAMDNVDGDITDNIKITGEVDTSKVGTYTITYTVSDAAKNKATKNRTIIVVEDDEEEVDQEEENYEEEYEEEENYEEEYEEDYGDITKPVIMFSNSLMQKINVGNRANISSTGIYGYTARDNVDGDITSKVRVTGDTGIINTPGTYTLYYTVTDSSGNTATKSRKFIVEANSSPTPPATTVAVRGVTLTPNNLTLKVGATYKLIITINPSNATNKTLTYTSTDPSVASVDSTGTIRALKAGTTKINAKSVNGKVGVSTITVK